LDEDPHEQGSMKRLCVFCGSNVGRHPAYAEAAQDLARALVTRKIDLVYGGARVGVIGVIPQGLVEQEVAHTGLPDLRVVASMHERKLAMAELSDGFIALPGGLGTLEELFEILTWAQLGLHRKPCGLLNIRGYYRRLIDFLDHAVAEQLLKAAYRALLLVEERPERLLDRFEGHRGPAALPADGAGTPP
jgi:predicted Rossmann-fold nucleotide-binding protein